MSMLRTFLITGSALMLLCACGNQKETPAAPAAEILPAAPKQEEQQPAEPPAETVVDGGDTREEAIIIKDTDGLPLVSTYVTRPDVTGLVESAAKKAIERYYDDLYRQEQEWWTDGLVDFARENKKAAADYGGDFLPFTVTETNEIVYDGKAFLSIRRDLETYTGGAHGSHAVSCDNFRKSDGSLVKLSELFRDGSYQDVLLEHVAAYIRNSLPENAPALYDNWEDTLKSTFDENHFFIDREALTIVYQEYDIAPYTSGAQFFPVAYADISNELSESFLRDIYGGKE